MATLPSNSNFHHIGYVKITDGTYIADVDSNGALEIALSVNSAIGDGSKNITTAGSREALASSTTCKKVIITAKETNTGTIWVGGATVSSGRGRPLVALQSETIDIDNLSKIYLDTSVNGDGVTFVYLS